MLPPHPPKIYKISSAFSYNFRLALTVQYRQETELTEAMVHALIERVEVDARNHVSITLRYRDEYRALLQLLEVEGEAVSA